MYSISETKVSFGPCVVRVMANTNLDMVVRCDVVHDVHTHTHKPMTEFTVRVRGVEKWHEIRRRVRNIPVLAIHSVNTYYAACENDLTLSHALGLIPVIYNEGTKLPTHEGFVYHEKCSCKKKKCAKCTVLFLCDVTEERLVTSDDFYAKFQPMAKLMPGIPITMGPLKLEAFAHLGTEIMHSKPDRAPDEPDPGLCYIAAIIDFRFPIHVSMLDTPLTPPQRRTLVESCPRNVFVEIEDTVRVDSTKVCSGCEECIRATRDFGYKQKRIEITYEEDTYIVRVECIGQLTESCIRTFLGV